VDIPVIDGYYDMDNEKKIDMDIGIMMQILTGYELFWIGWISILLPIILVERWVLA